jgi:alkanesulfonate monooxygenase SsuD/methylene tetrahydromethanopterin reductase-like flavin-dependent oxidoreductase (luciferase family)
MHFGVFMEEARPGVSQELAFREAFELVDAAEAWGLDGVWLGELHFNPARSVMSAPLVMAASIAARTKRLCVGTAVQLLPLNHPLRIAEEAATVDHISQGRLELGIGRSGSPRAYDVFGIPYAESQARFREALAVVLEAWKGEPFSFEGRYYRVENAVVSPRPYRQPHPPLRMAANTAETFPQVGQMGLGLFIGLRNLDTHQLRGHVAAYRRAWREAGHPGQSSVYLRVPVYAGTTEQGAVEEPRDAILQFFRRQAELARSSLAGSAATGVRPEQVEQMERMTYDEILATRVAFGTAARLIDRLGALRDELTLDGVVVELNAGGMLPPERATRTLRILTEEVIPAFR